MLIKTPGKVWVLTLLPGAVVALAPRHGLQIVAAGSSPAPSRLVVLARIDVVLLEYQLHLDFELPWRGADRRFFVYANWHLLWYGVIAAAAARRLAARCRATLAPLTRSSSAGAAVPVLRLRLHQRAAWVEDQSTVNRATLHLAPLIAVWMLLAFRAWIGAAARTARAGSAGRKCPLRACRDSQLRVLDLPGVTLCCIDTANHALALRALAALARAAPLRAHACS